ncbi:MAG: hypothetical protein JOZ69_05445 [Myxococcales bacterium]|nr:hypothetical protein [Myxococcales bacterium]
MLAKNQLTKIGRMQLAVDELLSPAVSAASFHGRDMIAIAFLYAGDPAVGEALAGPLRELGAPAGAHVGVQPYAAWQQAFDPLLTPGARNDWKSRNFSALP